MSNIKDAISGMKDIEDLIKLTFTEKNPVWYVCKTVKKILLVCLLINKAVLVRSLR